MHKTWSFGKFEGADLKYNNSFFEISAQKCPNKAFVVPIMTISFSCKKIHISENSIELISHIAIVFFKTLAKAHQYKAFLVLNLFFFIFGRKFALWLIRGCWFQIWQQFSKFQPKDTQLRQFWSQSYIFLFLHETLA